MEAPKPGEATRGVLTLAFGATQYLEMAKSLARSLQLHDPGVPRAIVTDSADPALTSLFTHVVPHRRDFGGNLRQKIHLDLYTPFDETMFIDSDSLVLRKLDAMWGAFGGSDFGTCGRNFLRRGQSDAYLHDLNKTLDRFDLEAIPKFNGGVYYFRKTPQAADFFNTAREILESAPQLGFVDFRGDGPNDETVYAVSMAIHGIGPTDMGTGGMFTPINAGSKPVIDVLEGVCSFVKDGMERHPDIMHFASATHTAMYLRECRKLECLGEGRRYSARDELAVQSEVLSIFLQRGRKVSRKLIARLTPNK